MAYASTDLNLLGPVMGHGTRSADANHRTNTSALWTLVSTEEVATVIAAGYVSDGFIKGVKENDTVIVIDTDLPSIDLCLVTVVDVSSNADGDVTMIQLA